ncbi:type IV secretory system conjugative DNA transfer family protein [Lactovum odontotermitis]
MNSIYKQWKALLANQWVLTAEAVIGAAFLLIVTSFILNMLTLFLQIFRRYPVKSLNGISENLNLAGLAVKNHWLGLLFPSWSSFNGFVYFVVFLIFAFVMGRHLYKHRIAFKNLNKGTEGTSRWTTEEELNKQYRLVSLDKKSEYSGHAGVPVAFHPDREHVWIDQTNTNVEVDGATQTGKTQTLTYPVLDLNIRAEIPDSMIINDIKGDILRRTFFHPLARRKFHFRVFNLIEPKNSLRYNPLYDIGQAYFQKNFAKAQRKAQTLSYIFYHNPEAKEPVWDEGAMAVFEAVTLWIAELALEYHHAHWVNMTALIDLIDYLATEKNEKTGLTRLDTYFMTLPTSSIVRRAYSIALKAEKRQTASFYMMVAAKLKYFFSEEIKYLTSAQDLDFLDLAYPKDGKPTLLFVVFPYSDFSNAKLLKMFFTQLYQKLAEETTLGEGKFDVRLRSWFEEAQNTPEIEGMERYTNVGLASGMMYGFIVQSHAGFEKVYGKETSENILGAAGNTYYIKTDILSEARHFSEQLGNTTVIAPQRSGSPLDSDKSFTEMEKGRPLLDPIELTRLMQSEWVLNRTKFTKDLKGKPIRPYPIKAFYEEVKNAQGHVTRYKEHTNAKFAYEYLFSEAGGDFDTHDKRLSDLELRENLEWDANGQARERIITDADLVIPHELLDTVLALGSAKKEWKNFIGAPEEKEELLEQVRGYEEKLDEWRRGGENKEQREPKNHRKSDLLDYSETHANPEYLSDPAGNNGAYRAESVDQNSDGSMGRNHAGEYFAASDELDISSSQNISPLERTNQKRLEARKKREEKVMMEMLDQLRNLEDDNGANIKALFGEWYVRFLDLISTYFGENHRRFVEDPTLSVKQFRNWMEAAQKSVQGRKFLAAFNDLKEKGEWDDKRRPGG